jgi:diguanylate cyclase (GGDEF)-like protein
MQLDTLTLMVPNAFSAAVAGCLLWGGWWLQFRNMPALLWWAAANLLAAVAQSILIAGISGQSSFVIACGVGLSNIGYALTWGGVQSFSKRPISFAFLAAGPLVWLAFALAPIADHHRWSTFASFVLAFIYLLASVWTLWRGREERLNARWPLMALLTLHACIFLGGSVELFFGTFALGQPPSLNNVFGIILFENVLYSMGTAIFMVLLCKERVEAYYIGAARIDSLTGTVNRGATFEKMRRLLNRCQRDDVPLSLIMFDLDHFKSINDTHGHQIGDSVLRAFADTTRGVLRPKDLFGRYGGEEFIVALPGATIETAYAIAQRVRVIFADNLRVVEGRMLNATVSAGVASILPGETLESVIGSADRAMYAAKAAGRNRVERAKDGPPPDGNTVIRVA